MTPRDPYRTLANALGSADLAYKALAAIDAAGLAVYKKKTHHNERRPTASTPMTDDVRQAIRAYYAAFPLATQSQIASKFNVNSGRVAEALR